MWYSVSDLLQYPFVPNDMPGYHVLLAAGNIAALAFVYHVLNSIFCLLDTPVASSHAPSSSIGSSSDTCSTSFGAKKEFPWKSPPKGSQESWWDTSKKLLKVLPPISWIVVLLDWEGRRQRKWDSERLRWRGLQQQLSILRAVRAKRRAAQQDPPTATATETSDANEESRQRLTGTPCSQGRNHRTKIVPRKSNSTCGKPTIVR